MLNDSFHYDNRFVQELPGESEQSARRRQVHGACWSPMNPTPVRDPQLLAHSPEMARALGISDEEVRSREFAEVFGGNRLLDGMRPYAACYGGHQFGRWAGQLGDGRAITLAEVVQEGQRWELQLKGAGETPYSRMADGRAVLRSSLREFLCSEAMHHLGVPTTRALSLVTTGEGVMRDMFYDGNPGPEPGAVVCRVAPSFLRFGNFEILSTRGDHALLRRLADFTMARDFPEIEEAESWFEEICVRTARMVAHWMRVGFVHGVMNTDNMSILGLTIDYGPYGWVDNFDPGWTPNTTDAGGRRYRFGNQPDIAAWNLTRLAEALAPLFATTEPLNHGLERYWDVYQGTERSFNTDKFGLDLWRPEDETLVSDAYRLLHDSEMDMTLFFRALASDQPDLSGCFYREEKAAALGSAWAAWLERYAHRVQGQSLEARRERMNGANPLYVPRNYLAQQAIEAAEQGDGSPLLTLLDTLRNPYREQPGREALAQKRPEWARHKAGCSMLSCSS